MYALHLANCIRRRYQIGKISIYVYKTGHQQKRIDDREREGGRGSEKGGDRKIKIEYELTHMGSHTVPRLTKNRRESFGVKWNMAV